MLPLMMDRAEELRVEGVVPPHNIKRCSSDGWYWKGGGEKRVRRKMAILVTGPIGQLVAEAGLLTIAEA